ncbi:hypothetical protein THERMOT_936, partial [Bathymodiolus thermophilus thioautotrophic gill symbiont]
MIYIFRLGIVNSTTQPTVIKIKSNSIMDALELYRQTYTYDTSNNLTHLSHQANSNTWQQTI